MEAPKDKRTQAYKEWVKNDEESSKGLGDTVEKITKTTGIKKVVEKFANGKDCGCNERKERLNKLIPYHKPNCLTEDEFKYLDAFFRDGRPPKVNTIVQQEIIDIYNRVFDDNKKPGGCSPCFVTDVLNKLDNIYNEYLG